MSSLLIKSETVVLILHGMLVLFAILKHAQHLKLKFCLDKYQTSVYLIGSTPEVGVPAGVYTLGVVGPLLVHVLHIAAAGAGQVGLLDGGRRS